MKSASEFDLVRVRLFETDETCETRLFKWQPDIDAIGLGQKCFDELKRNIGDQGFWECLVDRLHYDDNGLLITNLVPLGKVPLRKIQHSQEV